MAITPTQQTCGQTANTTGVQSHSVSINMDTRIVDPDTSNNYLYPQTDLQAIPACDLYTTKSQSATGMTVGVPFTYTMTYTNSGVTSADGARIDDNFSIYDPVTGG